MQDWPRTFSTKPAEEPDYHMVDAASSDDDSTQTPPSEPVTGNYYDDDAETVHSNADTELSNAETVDSEIDGTAERLGGSYIDLAAANQAENRTIAEDGSKDLADAVLSEVTLVPPTPRSGRSMYGGAGMSLDQRRDAYTVTGPARSASALGDASEEPVYSISSFRKSSNLFKLPGHSLRVLLVSDGGDPDGELEIIRKLISSMALGTCASDAKQAQVVELHVIRLPNRITVAGNTVVVDVLSGTTTVQPGQDTATIKSAGRQIFPLSKENAPDFAIFFHSGIPNSEGRSVYTNADQKALLAQRLAKIKVPLLEVSADVDIVNWTNDVAACVKHSLLHCTVQPPISRTSSKAKTVPIPMPLTTFISLNDRDLSMHLAYLEESQKSLPSRVWRSLQGNKQLALYPSLKTLGLLAYLVTVMMAVRMVLRVNPSLDAATQLSRRREALNLTLATMDDPEGVFKAANVDQILRYPTATTKYGDNVTIETLFPTSVDLTVLRPDLLLLAVPLPQVSMGHLPEAHIKTYRTPERMLRANHTHLTQGVFVINLDPSEAHGKITVNFVTSNTEPGCNDTIVVDLGNRLLQRVTYKQAAAKMHEQVQHDIVEARTAADAFKDNVLSVAKSAMQFSVVGFDIVRNKSIAAVQRYEIRFQEDLSALNQTARTLGISMQAMVPRMASVASSSLSKARHNARAMQEKFAGKFLQGKQTALAEPKGQAGDLVAKLHHAYHELATIYEDKLVVPSVRYARYCKSLFVPSTKVVTEDKRNNEAGSYRGGSIDGVTPKKDNAEHRCKGPLSACSKKAGGCEKGKKCNKVNKLKV